MTRILVLAMALLVSACNQDQLSTALFTAGETLAGRPAPTAQLRQMQQQRQQSVAEEATKREEVEASVRLFMRVWDETGDPFEARRQARAAHVALFVDPEWSRRLDKLTAIAWATQGGEVAGAECYIRGFQFGTAHHDQCVYDVKMEYGRQAAAPARAPDRPISIAPAAPPPARVEQDTKVYSADECIGPVIMGRCHGSILPNKAYHPTCYGAWLNGTCTGPMF